MAPIKDGPESSLFVPLTLRGNFSLARPPASGLSEAMARNLDHAPTGACVAWGIPFRIGRAALHDFRLFTSFVAALEGGVFFNLGSAVIIPETFLKAVSLARNLGHPLGRFTTVTLDFLKQYRALENVVHRPTAEGGQGYYLIGHHEILIPLLTAALVNMLD